MSYRVVFAPEAEAQLLSLYRYIAEAASPAISASYTEAIVEHCERLPHFPNRGAPRDDLRPGLRTIPFRRRIVIAYAAGEADVAILGIFYGGQDWEALLRED